MRGRMKVARLLPIAFAGSCLAAAGSPPAGGRDQDAAVAMLARSMQGAFRVNVEAIMIQRDHRGANSFMRIRVRRSKAGLQRQTVLEPLSRSGLDSTDDGDRWLTYFPDKLRLIDQESPRHENADIISRLDLAKKNYVFTTEPHADIAGRAVVCITASPRWPGIDGRRYCLDKQTAYPLRMETFSRGAAPSLVYDTKDVKYPPEMSEGALRMHPSPGVSKITYGRPRTMTRAEAKQLLNFIPIVPKSLPLGFKVSELQYSGNSEWKSAIVRLTDGLARANVYQWLPDGKDMMSMADSTAGESNGIHILLVSDSLSPALRSDLLDPFVSKVSVEK